MSLIKGRQGWTRKADWGDLRIPSGIDPSRLPQLQATLPEARHKLKGLMRALDSSRAWEIRRDAWRRLRHDQALARFHKDLSASNFINPPQRVALFREFKEGQVLRHEKRIILLRELCTRRPGVEKEEVCKQPCEEKLALHISIIALPSSWKFQSLTVHRSSSLELQ